MSAAGVVRWTRLATVGKPPEKKEFKTLEFLSKKVERVISPDELLNKAWAYQNYPPTRTVDNHMLRLRQKLESDPSQLLTGDASGL